MKRIAFVVVTVLFSLTGFSQQDSSHVRISLLTCGPGADLYSTWGHSAIRVTDTTTHSDRVYNYGTFDFYDPDFYINFIKGKLTYFLGVEQYPNFLRGYTLEQRSILEQELNLTGEEKLRLLYALRENAKEENKFYSYDFLFDNCSTRPRDIVRANTNSGLKFGNILPDGNTSFRNMIHYYLDLNHADWSKFGIDFLLGSGLDKKVQNEQAMFLPDYLYKGFDSAFNGNRPLVSKKNTIYTSTAPQPEAPLFTPFVLFALMLLLWLLLSRSKSKIPATTLRALDFLLFLTVGLMGVLLVFMWTGTNHQLCRNNYNLLWAIPFHVIAAFSIVSKKQWLKKYWLVSTLVYALLLLSWFFLPQQLNLALLPLIVLLGWRSFVFSRRS
ncbi:MAG: Lnb N-terminal periplasmic domain-containing protein [Agriterribacter sp.]